jgi:hypothetical protein
MPPPTVGPMGALLETGATGPRSLREARESGALLPLAQPLSLRRDPGRARTRAPVARCGQRRLHPTPLPSEAYWLLEPIP